MIGMDHPMLAEPMAWDDLERHAPCDVVAWVHVLVQWLWR